MRCTREDTTIDGDGLDDTQLVIQAPGGQHFAKNANGNEQLLRPT
jgi:hypothetical protein